MMGANLPHMWVSDASKEKFPTGPIQVPERDLVVQFNEDFAQKCIDSFVDCAELSTLLNGVALGHPLLRSDLKPGPYCTNC